jgi:hypothetical protein
MFLLVTSREKDCNVLRHKPRRIRRSFQ